MIAFGVIHLAAAEFIPARRSRGEVLVFQKGYYSRNRWYQDNEKGAPETFAQDVGAMAVRPNEDPGTNGNTLHHQSPAAEIQSRSAVFHWSKLSYSIKTESGTRQTLDDINGWVKPGTLTALMVGVNSLPKRFLGQMANFVLRVLLVPERQVYLMS